ncbi:hypothetical protein M011DRAFT_43670 [Sporormia fimetaria CBS 119925]|uniref:Uncharacterized protein n=1 Tax=Sporormia fimetaria CBS 119925 TaxID=1340428 RepID=A0A6A6UVY7_9PLEO|nr:hypothetical protein M011DRAFT_43670 [Sporormia fimetaria CBS 119925]
MTGRSLSIPFHSRPTRTQSSLTPQRVFPYLIMTGKSPSYLFHSQTTRTDTPRGSKTMAWGRRGYSKFYINRMGLAAAGYHRIKSQPIFEKDGEVDWQNPPDHPCVSNPENRIGEHKFGRSYRYTLKNMTGIYGVAFKAQAKKTFPE